MSGRRHRPSGSAEADARRRAWAEETLEALGTTRAGLSAGSCMWPFLPPGVRTTTRDAPPRVGEVAVYESGGALRAHRVVAAAPGALLTRPDRPGAALERVPLDRVRGVWIDGAGMRNVFLRPQAGRVVSRLSAAVARPGGLAAARALLRRADVLPAPALRLGIARGGPEDLLRTLNAVGHSPRQPSLEALAEAFLDPGAPGVPTGFVAVARSLGRVIGAILVEGDGETKAGRLTLALRRGYRRGTLAAALLELVADEAMHRGFEALFAEAREGAPESGGLDATGFVLLEADHRRVPATGTRIGRYRLIL
jgi:hypothetical protein